jgi:rsbT co-antagonist protein RsbR
MRQAVQTAIPALIERYHERILADWLACQKREGALGRGQIGEGQLADQSKRFLTELRQGVSAGTFDDLSSPEWDSTRTLLDAVAGERAVQGFSPGETAVFVFSLKEPLFTLLRQEVRDDVDALARETWAASQLIDKLGLIRSRLTRKAAKRSSCDSRRNCSNCRPRSSSCGTESSRCR